MYSVFVGIASHLHVAVEIFEILGMPSFVPYLAVVARRTEAVQLPLAVVFPRHPVAVAAVATAGTPATVASVETVGPACWPAGLPFAGCSVQSPASFP